MTQIPDRMKALVAILKADSGVATQVSTRVFSPKLPPASASSWGGSTMPCKAVALGHGGGLDTFGGGFQQFGDSRVDVRCWGATDHEADEVWRAVHSALKQLRRTLSGSILIYWANPAGGPMQLVDPDTTWPYVFASFQVLASEVAHA